VPTPPNAEPRPHTLSHLGHTWTDEYAWLRDRDDPRVLEHLQAENAHTEHATAHLDPTRQALYDEILGRIQEDDADPPWRRGPWLYYTRTEQGRPYSIHCRRRAPDGREEVLLDENEVAGDREYFHLGALAISPDHARLAWASDTDGSERYAVRIKDLATGEVSGEVATGAKTTLVWATDGRHLFYSTPDDTDRPYRLWRYDRLAPDQPAVLVFEEPDPAFFLGAHRSRDQQWIVLGLHSKVTSEVHLLPADDPTAAFRGVRPRVQEVEYTVEPHGEHLFVLDNAGAPNFRLLRLPAAGWEVEPEVVWTDDPEVYLTGLAAFANHLVVWIRKNGLSGLRVLDLRAGTHHDVAFEEPAWVVRPERNTEYETTEVRMTYESLVTPPSVLAYDLDARTIRVLKRTPVPHYDPSDYTTARTWATSHDGMKVPVTLLYRTGTRPDGDNPALLAGYGAYGIDSEPWFRRTWLSLADRGVVCALAHVRGGSELGRRWYESGKFLHKENSFRDLVACAEHLQEQRWTRPERLGIWGGSAGGLLVGAVTNLRPDLFACVLALVPFVDVVNTMLDESLPLTITEYEEWGDLREPEYFEYIRGYAPYENVGEAAYPAVLATAGLNDPRVGYWEAAKWVQRLRDHTTSDAPILLRVNMGAGHAGASGRYGRIEEAAFEYAFLLDRIGAVAPPDSP